LNAIQNNNIYHIIIIVVEAPIDHHIAIAVLLYQVLLSNKHKPSRPRTKEKNKQDRQLSYH